MILMLSIEYGHNYCTTIGSTLSVKSLTNKEMIVVYILAALLGLTFYIYGKRNQKSQLVRHKLWFTGINLLYESSNNVDDLLDLRTYVKQTWRANCYNIDQECRVLNVLLRIEKKIKHLS